MTTLAQRAAELLRTNETSEQRAERQKYERRLTYSELEKYGAARSRLIHELTRARTLRWNREGESLTGGYSIRALYRSCTTVQGYELTQNGTRLGTYSTRREARAAAER